MFFVAVSLMFCFSAVQIVCAVFFSAALPSEAQQPTTANPMLETRIAWVGVFTLFAAAVYACTSATNSLD